MNTDHFQAWLRAQGLCFNHMTVREQREAIARYKASMR